MLLNQTNEDIPGDQRVNRVLSLVAGISYVGIANTTMSDLHRHVIASDHSVGGQVSNSVI